MTKTKHIHVVLATITLAVPYNPDDLAELTTINAQVRDAARKLTGYRDIEVRIGKIPAPAATTITEPMVPKGEPLLPRRE